MWKQIENYENYYVNEKGQIKREKSFICDSKGHKYELPTRLLKPWKDKRGYLHVSLSKNGKVHTEYVHRLVAKYFLDSKNIKATVNHKDGNKENNHYENLEYATYSENNQHAYNSGLKLKGENFYNSKLTECEVNEIKRNGKFASYHKIAKKYNVAPATIRDILMGKTWKN